MSSIVNDVAPSIAYSSAYYGYTAGLTAQTFTPTMGGGAVNTGRPCPSNAGAEAVVGNIQ